MGLSVSGKLVFYSPETYQALVKNALHARKKSLQKLPLVEEAKP